MVYEKRGQWHLRDKFGLRIFNTEAEARAADGVRHPAKEMTYGGSPEEKAVFKEEASPDEQEFVFESESGSEEEV
jgi:hypothetical protein